MQGYTTRDRRSAHVRQADEAAEAVLAAATDGDLPGADGVEDEAAGMGAAVGGTSSLFKQESEFLMLVQTGRLLLEQSRLAEAKALMDNAIRLFAK